MCARLARAPRGLSCVSVCQSVCVCGCSVGLYVSSGSFIMSTAGAAGVCGPGPTPGPNHGASNPRKFSEKIALHTQRQAEDTAAFQEVMMDLTSTRVTHTHTFKGPGNPVKMSNTCFSLDFGNALGGGGSAHEQVVSILANGS